MGETQQDCGDGDEPAQEDPLDRTDLEGGPAYLLTWRGVCRGIFGSGLAIVQTLLTAIEATALRHLDTLALPEGRVDMGQSKVSGTFCAGMSKLSACFLENGMATSLGM